MDTQYKDPLFTNILSYYAGFIDGEAHIGIKKLNSKKGYSPNYSERISVAGINKNSILGLNDLMNGHIYFHKGSKLSRVGYWSWELTDNKAKNFLRMIRPFLKIKAIDADLVLALSKLKESNGRRKITEKDINMRETLYILLKKIHHKND